METTQMCYNRWIDQENIVYVHSGVYSAIRKNGGHHAKWSKSDSERQMLYVFSHTWKINIYTKTNIIIYTHISRINF
jgi:hypothetical protein